MKRCGECASAPLRLFGRALEQRQGLRPARRGCRGQGRRFGRVRSLGAVASGGKPAKANSYPSLGNRWTHNHHNFAWLEEHSGRKLWVVRKGATPAFPGQEGFVGGSIGNDAVVLEGAESEKARRSLCSTIHGAGRVLGRKDAKRRLTRAQMDAWLRERGVTLIGADLDKSPMAYRRLPDVLRAHAGTVKVLHTLRPFVVIMAGAGEADPWKD